MADNREHTEALDLEALRDLAVRARADYESYHDNGWASDYADDVTALIAEVDRLHRQITQLADDLHALGQQYIDDAAEWNLGVFGEDAVGSSAYFDAARRARSLLPEADQPENK